MVRGAQAQHPDHGVAVGIPGDVVKDLARDLNPDRPGRYEPRVVKRRPKPFPRMQQPRQVLRQQLVRA